MDMDRIERDSDELRALATDLRETRELALGEEEGRIAAEIAELEERRDSVRRQRQELHNHEVDDERRIARDATDLADALGDRGCHPSPVHPPAVFAFFVDGKPYETDLPRLTGLQIKAKVHDWDQAHDLVLEGEGSNPDRIVADTDVVDLLVSTSPLHFCSVPKANFG